MYVGFMFAWHEVNKHLTGKDWVDDSGPAEKYAGTLGLEAIVVDYDLFIGKSIEDVFANEPEKFAFGSYTTIDISRLLEISTEADRIKQKLEATGLKPENSPILFDIEYHS